MSHIYSSPTKPRLLSSAVAVACCLLPFQTASAYSLQDILRDALISDPIVREAKATQEAAQSTTKATRARHYPVVTLTGTKVLAQHNKYTSNDMEDGVGVRGSLNIYSWGAIEAAVRRDRSREEYYQHKYTESQEQLGSDIGRLYLSALRAKETLILNEQTLARHNNLLKDLNTIVKYDAGRRSELIEARARQLQVANIIAQQRRTMDLALSRLSRYTSRQLTANDLEDPFKKTRQNPSANASAAPTATIIRPIRRSWPNVTASVPTWTPPKPNGCLPSIWKAVQRATPNSFI